LLRIPTLTHSLNVLRSFNVVLNSWNQFLPTQAKHLIPYDRDQLLRALQTLSWWNANFLFIMTDSPPSSGTDDGGVEPSATFETNECVYGELDEDRVDRFPA